MPLGILYPSMPKLALIALLVLPSLARASAVVALDEAALVQRADTIAYGKIVATSGVRTKSGQIVTLAELQVYRGLRGVRDGETLTLAVPGGRVSGIVAEVSGAPRPEVGQLVFGFFETHGDERRPLALRLGFVEVRAVSGELRVFRELEGLEVVGKGEVERIAGEPLTQFLARIRARVDNAPLPTPKDGVLR